MAVANAVAATLAAGAFLAVVVVRAPLVGLMNHPRTSLFAAVLGVVLAATVVIIQISAALTFGMNTSDWIPIVVTNYFLAMANRLVGGPYPFAWSPVWMFRIGSLTPLIPFGAILALAAGYSAHRYARRTAVFTVAVACCLLLTYMIAGAYAASATWGGVPL